MQGKDLTNQVIIVTGANTGLGKDTARYKTLFLLAMKKMFTNLGKILENSTFFFKANFDFFVSCRSRCNSYNGMSYINKG